MNCMKSPEFGVSHMRGWGCGSFAGSPGAWARSYHTTSTIHFLRALGDLVCEELHLSSNLGFLLI